MPETNSRDQITAQTIRAWAGETIFKRGQDYLCRGAQEVLDLYALCCGATGERSTRSTIW